MARGTQRMKGNRRTKASPRTRTRRSTSRRTNVRRNVSRRTRTRRVSTMTGAARRKRGVNVGRGGRVQRRQKSIGRRIKNIFT